MASDSDMRDWWDINRLMIAYSRACDTFDWTAYRALFTEDAEIDYSGAYGRTGTIEEIARWMPTIMNPASLPRTQHMLANLTVEVAGDTAKGEVYYLNPDVLAGPAGQSLLVNGGQYRFIARRGAGGWRLARLEAELYWSTVGELVDVGALNLSSPSAS